MGMFKTKKKHVVNTTVTRVVEDAQLPDSVKSAITHSLIQNDDQLMENMLEGLVSCIGMKANRMYEYAGTHYTYGRPTSHNKFSNYGNDTVITFIQGLIGPTATIDYYQFGPLNNLHDGWARLVTDYGYKSSTNRLDTLTAAKGSPVYLKDMVIVLAPASMGEASLGGLEKWGTPPTAGITPTRPLADAYAMHSPIISDPNTLVDGVKVTYQWKPGNFVLEESMFIPFNATAGDADFFQVKYFYNGEAGYWYYKAGEGTYPILDALFTTTANNSGNYFPFIYFRYNNTSMGANPLSQGYLTSKRLVKYLGMDYDTMLDGVNSNPDITSVEQAMMMMAVPANTTAQMDRRYLYDFFDQVATYASSGNVTNIDSTPSDQRWGPNALDGEPVYIPPPKFSWIIQDTRFKMVLNCDGVYQRQRTGTVAAVGDYTSEFKEVAYTVKYTEIQQIDGIDQEVEATRVVTNPTYFYRKQLTANVYEEIEVVNLQSRYHVWGDLTTVGDETDPILLVPLDYSIVSNYNIPDRELLYARSLHFVFNSHQIIKIKWYQTGIFKIILVIVAVIIAYYTGYFDPVLLGLAAGGTAAAIAIVTAILEYLVVSYLFKLFVKVVGAKVAFIVAIVAFVLGAYQAIDAGSIAGAPWAQELLTISSNLTTGIGDQIQTDMKELGKEAAAFGDWMKQQTKLLDTANELLEQGHKLSPFVIFGEHPNDFYNRTVHSGNIGIVGVDAITAYVDVALTLPKLTDTMGYN